MESRVIKFRCYCEKHKRWEYYTLGDLVCGGATTSNGEGGIFKWWGEFIGLHDKNGKECYISDFIKDHNGRVYECKMSDDYLEVFFVSDDGRSLTPYGLLLKGGTFEIVGNSFQNT